MISVVIPVKNRASLIGRCLDSIKSQTYRPLQVIVVDNNSTDCTIEVVEKWKAMNCNDNLQLTILEEKMPGAAAAREKGLSAVTTEWVLFFDSDDEMRKDMISSIMAEIGKDNSLDLIYWNCIVHTDRGDKKRVFKFGKRSVWSQHIYNGLLFTLSFAVKTEFIRNVGGWNTSLRGWDDWELGVRLLLANPIMKEIPHPLAIIHPQEDSITGINHYSKAGVWEEAIDACEQDIRKYCIDSQMQNKLLRMVNYRRINLAALYRAEKRVDLAKPLLQKALAHPTVTPLRKLLARLIYTYTFLGGRMAYLFWH